MNEKKYVAFESEIDSEIYFDFLVEDIENSDTLKNGLFIGMNSDFVSVNFDIVKTIDDDVLDYSDYDLQVYYKNNKANMMIDALKKYKSISLKQALKIAKIVDNYNNNRNKNRYDVICDILSVVYCSVFDYAILRGCSQSDWIYAFYNTQTISLKYIAYVESVFFNTGLEIVVSSTPIEIDTESDIDDIKDMILSEYDHENFYTSEWNIENRKIEVAKNIGCTTDDIIYFAITDSKVISYTKYSYERY